MKPWPVYRDFAVKFGPTNLASEAYNNARAWAAMERLRVAVKALRAISEKRRICADGIYWDMRTSDLQGHATEALEDIGQIPEEAA
jgi:hypothetical protein